MGYVKYIIGLGALILSSGVLATDKNMMDVGAPDISETEHRGTFGGETVRYKVIAGETFLKNKADKATAAIYSVSYIRTDIEDAEKRPVFFIFNGGPGSSSVWLHMGVYGPKRAAIPSDAKDDGSAPFNIVDNPGSILDIADMVFIDPVGTGFSRAIGDGNGKDFWGVEKDAKSVAEFIRLWLNKHNRWNSPKYLSGESYGTTRAAALLNELQGGWTDIAINGVIMISSILDFQTARYQPGNDTPYISYLPTMAAAGWYHGKVEKQDRTIEAFLDEVRTFTLGDYAAALLQGNRLGAGRFDDIAQRLSDYTGVSKTYFKNANLRVSNFRFMKELLRDEGYSIGRLDARYKGKDYEVVGDRFDADPSAYGIDAGYTAALNHYMRNDLNVRIDRKYEILARDPGRNWEGVLSGSYSGGYVNVAPHVGRALRENSGLKVMVANGYYDFATPFFASENTYNANGIDTSRVDFTYYEAGHMMYVHEPSLDQLIKDIRAFIAK
jgi:carboxypeptidase C (cathepsin A)